MKKHALITTVLLFGFILGIHKGNVALWKDGMKEPIKVFPYQASQLPQADQQRLQQGVHVDSISQLRKLIQDYFS